MNILKLRALRVLRGENFLIVNPEVPLKKGEASSSAFFSLPLD